MPGSPSLLDIDSSMKRYGVQFDRRKNWSDSDSEDDIQLIEEIQKGPEMKQNSQSPITEKSTFHSRRDSDDVMLKPTERRTSITMSSTIQIQSESGRIEVSSTVHDNSGEEDEIKMVYYGKNTTRPETSVNIRSRERNSAETRMCSAQRNEVPGVDFVNDHSSQESRKRSYNGISEQLNGTGSLPEESNKRSRHLRTEVVTDKEKERDVSALQISRSSIEASKESGRSEYRQHAAGSREAQYERPKQVEKSQKNKGVSQHTQTQTQPQFSNSHGDRRRRERTRSRSNERDRNHSRRDQRSRSRSNERDRNHSRRDQRSRSRSNEDRRKKGVRFNCPSNTDRDERNNYRYYVNSSRRRVSHYSRHVEPRSQRNLRYEEDSQTYRHTNSSIKQSGNSSRTYRIDSRFNSANTSDVQNQPTVSTANPNDGNMTESTANRESNLGMTSPSQATKIVGTATGTKTNVSVASSMQQPMARNTENDNALLEKTPAEILKLLKKCRVCRGNKEYKTRQKALEHLKKDHEKKLCFVCFEAFPIFGIELKEHFIKTHTNQDKSEKAQCPACNEKFGFDGMYIHISKNHLKPIEQRGRKENKMKGQDLASQTKSQNSKSPSTQTSDKPKTFHYSTPRYPKQWQGTGKGGPYTPTSSPERFHKNRGNFRNPNHKVPINCVDNTELVPNPLTENSTRNEVEYNLAHAPRRNTFKIPRKQSGLNSVSVLKR